MIILGTTHTLQVVTTGTANIDVSASWADMVASVVTPGPSDTKINTATTTTIVAAPASGFRTIRNLSVFNVHATTANTVTVERYNGSTAVRLFKVILAAGESLIYDEANSWQYISAAGLVKTAFSQGSSAALIGALNLVVLSADVTNNNAVANTIADVTGLSFPVVTAGVYFFEFSIDFTSAATTTGTRFSLNGPTATRLEYTSEYSLTTTTKTVNNLVAYDLPAAANATVAATTGNHAWISGFITPSADGNVIARFASEVASSAIVAKRGSVCRWIQVA